MDDFERDFEEFLVADTDPEPHLFELERTDEELQMRRGERLNPPLPFFQNGIRCYDRWGDILSGGKVPQRHIL